MTTIIFLHGAGAGAYDEDARMVAGLARHLGDHDTIDYPRLPEANDGDDQAWHRAIGHALERAHGPVFLVAHSAGGYVAVKHLASRPVTAEVAGLFLIAAPFPGGDPDWTFPGFELPENFGRSLPAGMPVYLYAAEDDEVVPFAHRDLYAAAIPGAVVRTVTGGHELGDDLAAVAADIRALAASRSRRAPAK